MCTEAAQDACCDSSEGVETPCDAGEAVSDAALGGLVRDWLICQADVSRLRRFLDICPPPEALPGALTASYWLDASRAAASPSNPVEALVAIMMASNDVTDVVGEVEGIEWWWQDVDCNDPPKAYHTDRNVWREEGEYRTSHPAWSSVLYLCSEGGATVMFWQDEVLAVWPEPGRYLLFPGDRPHGVLHSPTQVHSDRVTLLVNWWRQRPPGLSDSPKIDSSELDDDWRLDAAGAAAAASTRGCLLAPTVVPLEVSFVEHEADWKRQRLPCDLQREAMQESRILACRYKDGCAGGDWWE